MRKLFFFLGSLIIILLSVQLASAQVSAKPRFKAIAFDYFVIFNPNSVIPEVEKFFPGKGAEFTKMWRAKQFEYCFLRSITNNYADFFQVTEDALVYTAESFNLELSPEAKTQLLDAYLNLSLWPDAADGLRKLKQAGVRIITIANFTKKMLTANADHAGITPFFENLLSTEEIKVYKPDPRAYELGLEKLKLKKEEVVFAAFGGWDVFGAKSFGYTTYWVNRFNLPAEKTGIRADQSSTGMDGLLDLVLGYH